MAQGARKLATYADLLALGEERHHEVLAGELVDKASPSPAHGRAQRTLSRYLGGPFDDDDGRGGPGGWWILTEVEVELAAHEIVRPDLAGWRRERLPSPWHRQPIGVAPDWVCEILSPSYERRDRVHKADLYATSGVAHCWMVAPSEQLLEAHELRAGVWVRLGAWGRGQTARIPPFAAVELDVSRLFPPEGG